MKVLDKIKQCPKFAFQMAAVSIGVLKITSALGGKLLPGMQSILFNNYFILSPWQCSLIGVVIISQLEILRDDKKKHYHTASLVMLLGTALQAVSNVDSVIFNYLIAPASILSVGLVSCMWKKDGELSVGNKASKKSEADDGVVISYFKEILYPMVKIDIPFAKG